jgi:Ca-activated chloride channel family protein
MKFEWPGLLWVLLLTPVAALLWLRGERGRAGRAAAFGNPNLLPGVLTGQPGWRRLVPAVLYLVAGSVALVALARPEAVARVPRDEATVMLAVDTSSSMLARDVAPNRILAARQAIDGFLDQVPDRLQVGLVTFAATARVESRPTTDRAAIREALANAPVRPGTAIGDGLQRALEASRGAAGQGAGQRPPTAVLLMSDGLSSGGVAPLAAAEQARREGVAVFTVALGSPGAVLEQPDGSTVPLAPDEPTLRQMAELTGGQFLTATDRETLAAVYRNLGSRLAYVSQDRELTSVFLGGAAVLLLAGAATSILWFRRVP